jgi:aminoglycoside phosphotransferase (APT) family kinase protein
MLFGAVPSAVDPFTERFGDRVGPERLALVQRLAPRAPEVVDRVWRPPFVVAHGDYRLDNMMFGTGDGAPPISVLDWQACRLAPPGLDAAIFLSSCLDTETRRATERGQLEAYVDGLAAAGVEGFGFDAAWQSYRAASLYPFLLCVFTSITLEQTERGDAMWTQLLCGAADLVLDTDAAAVLD